MFWLPDFLHAFDVVTELDVQVLVSGLEGFACLAVLLAVQEPAQHTKKCECVFVRVFV